MGEINRPQTVCMVMVIEQSLGSCHICGVSIMLVVVVVLLFLVLVQGLTKVSDQSRALEDRNDSNNKRGRKKEKRNSGKSNQKFV